LAYTLIELKEFLAITGESNDALLQLLLDEALIFCILDGVSSTHQYFPLLHKYRTLHEIICYNNNLSKVKIGSASSSGGGGIQSISLSGLGITFAGPTSSQANLDSISPSCLLVLIVLNGIVR
jgi:hypothetical protein